MAGSSIFAIEKSNIGNLNSVGVARSPDRQLGLRALQKVNWKM
ncbi:hypothetical protein [Tychonema sp. LEGE 07203]|nr:hypothetical protein [Tychonema sp. LEGE 07203]